MNKKLLVMIIILSVLVIASFVTWFLLRDNSNQDVTNTVRSIASDNIMKVDQGDGWTETKYARESNVFLSAPANWELTAYNLPTSGLRLFHSETGVELRALAYLSNESLDEWKDILAEEHPGYTGNEEKVGGRTQLKYVATVTSESALEDLSPDAGGAKQMGSSDGEITPPANYIVGVIVADNSQSFVSECVVSGEKYGDFIDVCNRIVGIMR